MKSSIADCLHHRAEQICQRGSALADEGMHVKKFPNVRTNSHPRCTRENGVLVANVAIVVIIVDTNFALKVRVTFNMSVTLFKVSLKVSSALCERSVHSVRVWV